MKKINILFADDDLDIQQSVGFILEAAGFELVFADNGVQALEVSRTTSLDLAILDVMMPRMNGLQVCKIMRSNSTIPILLVTGRAGKRMLSRA